MDPEQAKHITLRIPLRRRVEFAVACDLLDVTMSKKLHRVIADTIANARQLNPDFEKLVEKQLAEELGEVPQPPTSRKK